MPPQPILALSACHVNYDLNCDLGEGEPRQVLAGLMRCVTSANIACGGHAGDYETMRAAANLAVEHDVRIGAHPGLPDRDGFGRRATPIGATMFKTLLLQQVGALEKIVRHLGRTLHHIKLHGALYHMVEEQAPLCRAYIEMVREFWPRAVIFALAGGSVSKKAREAGLKSWGEGFLDRAYIDETHLAPRGAPGSILTEEEFENRLERLVQSRMILASSTERPLSLPARTWCIHADTKDAPRLARRARQEFDKSAARRTRRARRS
jgi:UPF0271 protein